MREKMIRVSNSMPENYKNRFKSMADTKGISKSELLRQWIDYFDNKQKNEENK